MDEDCCSIFVGSVPADVDAEALEALCSAFGEVVRVDLKRGYAFVDFASPEGATAALVLNGQLLGRRAIAVRLNTDDHKKNKRPRPDPAGTPPSPAVAAACQSVFVGGLPITFAERDVLDLFAPFGDVARLELKKGFAFVDFADTTGAAAACCMDGYEAAPGMRLGVRLNLPEHKKGGRPEPPVLVTATGPIPASKKSRPEAADTCTSVFVGGLPVDVGEAQIAALFAPCGGVTAVHMKKGFAFVEFEEPDHAQAACALDGTALGSRAIAVRLNLPEHKTKAAPAVGPLHPAGLPIPVGGLPAAAGTCKSVFVGGLPPDAKETDLQHLFAFCGPMERLSLKKSYAFIDFVSPMSAQVACGLDGYVFQGKPIGIRINTAEARAGARGASPPPAAVPTAPAAGAYLSPLPSALGSLAGSGYSVFSTSPFISGTPTTVFVGGLPPETSPAGVQQLFASFGSITDVRVKKGYAFVDFSRPTDALRACSLDGLGLLGGRRLGVRINNGAETDQQRSGPLR